MAMTGNMDRFLVDYVGWCGVVLFCLALPLDIFIRLPVYLPAPLYVSLLGWICLLLSSLVRNHCSCSRHWRCYDEITLFHNLSPIGQRRVRGTKRWLQSLGIMALVSLRVRNSGSFRCHRMSSTRPGYRFPARRVGPFHGLSPSLTMEKIEKIWNIETMFASNSILALVIPTYSYLGSCFEWWCFGFPTQAVYLCLHCRSTPNSPITYTWDFAQVKIEVAQVDMHSNDEQVKVKAWPWAIPKCFTCNHRCAVLSVSADLHFRLGEGKTLEPLQVLFFCVLFEATWVDEFCEIPSKLGWFW